MQFIARIADSEWLRTEAAAIIDSAYQTVRQNRNDWGSRVEPLSIDVNQVKGSLCNVSRKSTGKFHEAVKVLSYYCCDPLVTAVA